MLKNKILVANLLSASQFKTNTILTLVTITSKEEEDRKEENKKKKEDYISHNK